ncbi:prepilin-type N-terminal cleavage/methylation domain-containing protein [Pseudomonas sp. JL972]|uniref:GspH/FimT family pseudopilin n=1 Tax=Stutzerimonas degradans TaxID=2968968 RepID=UPI0012D960F0|nr:GspH/FimT family pseudopilin [Stutzerimonas degradans]MTZ14242.1 prepilin-type N-terminal cleavage/methylation domain-containing protein [Stutzerimonas degradans]
MLDKDQGFTVVELLTTLALLAIIASIALPALADLIAYNRQQALLTQVQEAVQNARTKAVLHRQTIVLCGTQDATNCSNNWSDGWLTRSETSQEVLHVTELSGADELHWSSFGGQRIRFFENGTSPTSNGRFFQCYKQRIAWQLILSRQGRLKRSTPAEDAHDAARCIN